MPDDVINLRRREPKLIGTQIRPAAGYRVQKLEQSGRILADHGHPFADSNAESVKTCLPGSYALGEIAKSQLAQRRALLLWRIDYRYIVGESGRRALQKVASVSGTCIRSPPRHSSGPHVMATPEDIE